MLASIGATFEGEREMTRFITMLKDETGASAAEYALILAIVGAAIAFAAIFLGAQIATAVNDAGTCISSNGTSCP